MIIDQSADMSSSRRRRSSTDDDDNRDTYMQIIKKKKKMKMMMSSSSLSMCLFSLLTEDLMVQEILLKLPMDSLLRLRCVSKYFQSLITSPSFVRKHLHAQFNNNRHSILISSCFAHLPKEDQHDDRERVTRMVFVHRACSNFSTNSGDEYCPSRPDVVRMHCPFTSVGIQASCNGLLFFHGTMMRNYITPPPSYLWNPCTKEYRELRPPSRLGDYLFEGIPDSCCSSIGYCGFGYDRTNDEYKILYHENRVSQRFYYDDDDDDDDVDGFGVEDDNDDYDDLVSITEFKLYKLGTNTWTRVGNPYRSLFFGQLFFGLPQKIRTGLLANGALHWLMSSSPSPSNHATNAKIISFDMEKEEFGEVEKPQYSTVEEEKEYCYGALQVLKGCLCLSQYLFYDFSKVDILMLKDYTAAADKNSWTKLFTIAVSDRLFWRSLKLLTFCENGEIIMYRGRNDLISYNPINQKARRVEKLESLQTDWTNEVSYIESLVSLNSGTYMRPTAEGNQLPDHCSQIVSKVFVL